MNLKQPNLKKITRRKNEVISLKKSNVSILFDAEKLSAVKMYMSQRNLDFKNELEKSIEAMYSKYVPSNVREFIDMKSALTKPVKSKTKTAPPEENDTGDTE